ncbi:hypothetical protein RchiOBHm_Chr6g0257481 [Rosa chinensis]|uniref:Uncharacterized protein n=1 Tax=Rosa chinensis TaxID=74649 RepID=A0A2P6PMD7_ROSCH|nr:hypothetical protein RchiOBHm_Chr6g0257481 [Rosa chinensis]
MVFGQEVIGNELSWLGSDLGWEVMQIQFCTLPIYRGALVGFCRSYPSSLDGWDRIIIPLISQQKRLLYGLNSSHNGVF